MYPAQLAGPIAHGYGIQGFSEGTDILLYGEMTAEALLDGALLSLGAGATGFAFFSAADFDDGAKILAMSSATALAAPFEDYFFLGKPLGSLDIAAS